MFVFAGTQVTRKCETEGVTTNTQIFRYLKRVKRLSEGTGTLLPWEKERSSWKHNRTSTRNGNLRSTRVKWSNIVKTANTTKSGTHKKRSFWTRPCTSRYNVARATAEGASGIILRFLTYFLTQNALKYALVRLTNFQKIVFVAN